MLVMNEPTLLENHTPGGHEHDQSKHGTRSTTYTKWKESPDSGKIVLDAIKEFGTTESRSEAGYLLRDGEMLDLSGKNEGGPAGTRSLDHRSVSRVLDTSGTKAMLEFMTKTGSVRHSFFGDSAFIDTSAPLTRAQIRKVADYVAEGIDVEYDINSSEGDSLFSGEILSGIGLSEFKLLSDNFAGVETLTQTAIDEVREQARKLITDQIENRLMLNEPTLLNHTPGGHEHDQKRHGRKKGSKQTDTKEFKKWFGKSKVVDEDGKPLVVYHGTPTKFSTFQPTISERTIGGLIPIEAKSDVFFFTPDKQNAWEWGSNRQQKMRGDVFVIDAFLRLENPIDIRGEGIIETWVKHTSLFTGNETESTVLEYLRDHHPILSEWSEARWLENGIDANNLEIVSHDGMTLLWDESEFTSALRELEFDGAIVGEGKSRRFGGTSYIAFDPSQIKSATDNKGTFDPNDPDIRNQEEESIVVTNNPTPLMESARWS